jgi:hypothetical protein
MNKKYFEETFNADQRCQFTAEKFVKMITDKGCIISIDGWSLAG